MRFTFKESRGFTERVITFLDDESYASFQKELAANPQLGSVMPGCGGLRKIRLGDPRRGKGKRSGARVIYLHVPEVDLIFLIAIYGKDEKDDLSPEERKLFRKMAEMARQEFLDPERQGTDR